MSRAKVVFTRDGLKYFVGDREVSKEEYDGQLPDKEIGVPEAASPAIWQDHTSLALSVHPDQVAEANARNARHGLSAYYDADGTCHIPDRKERSRLMRLEGMHDREGGYGD